MVTVENTFYMTEQGKQKAELLFETLLNETRPEIVGYLSDANDGGDASDNSEYLYLVQELESIDRRIRDLRYKLDRVQIIERDGSTESITLGSKVVIQENGSAPETYTIVGSAEADPDQGSVSNESPLGKALLDRRIGEEVIVDSPGGPLRFLIVDIS